MAKKDALVIGLGIAGCSAARQLADIGYTVTCLEMESHIGGTLFEEERPNGIRVQTYGPRVFHTDNETVYQFARRFGSFFPYRHRVLVSLQDMNVPLPLNARSLEMLFGKKQAEQLLSRIAAAFPGERRVSCDSLVNSRDSQLIDLGRFIIENILTADINKKEGSDFIPADDSFENAAYVDTGSDDCFYTDSIQAMPMQGFMSVMENMLDHPAITVYLNTNSLSRITLHEDNSTMLLDGIPFKGPVIYTASLDKLFNYCYGALPYRTKNISFQDIDADFQNECAVILHPKDSQNIRISESKYMTLQDIEGKTSLVLESAIRIKTKSAEEPFEPALSEESRKLYAQYVELTKNCPSLHLLGRMACYRNSSIAGCIERALDTVARV